MIGKKINQLATELAPDSTDLTIIGDPISGVSKKITLAQLGAIFSGAVSFYTNLAAFPVTGDINVIYCAKDTQKLYLWSGSAYVEVFPSQALLNTYQLRSEKGVSNGYASLDSAGKVPIGQLPSSIMEYKGTWNAATNTPTLANGTGDTGDVYICNVAGTVNFGAGPITFAVGDYVIYSGTIWQRSSGAVGTVTSVAASITGDAIGITGSPITTSGTLALAFAGTSAQYINGAGNLTTFPTSLVSGSGASGQVTFFNGANSVTGTNNFFWDATNNRLGIGTTTPQRSIEIYNTTADNHLRLSGNAPSVSMGEAVTGSVYQAKFGLVTTNGQFVSAGVAGDFVIISQTGATIIGTSSTEKMRVNTSGNVSINNTNNTYKLDVTGTGRYTGQLRLESTITDGTNTYTLPSATGTLALTSQLTGGTVTSVGLSSATSGVTIGSTPITTSGTITLAIATASGSQQGLLSSTDWTTFNNKQSALTNPVTGTGTTNYLPKFTGASTIGNSAIQTDSTGNLMVGSANSGNAGTINVSVGVAGTTAGGLQLWAATNQTHFIQFGDGTTGAQVYAGYMAYAHSTDSLLFGTNGADKMTLNASGNLGLGVTPSAWLSSNRAFQIGYGAVRSFTNSANTYLENNNYVNTSGTDIYLNNGGAGRYRIADDAHIWYQAPSGTAGNAISFTQAMTLTAAGRLLINKTNEETYQLDVNGTGRFTATSTTPALKITLIANANATLLSSVDGSGYGWELQQEEVSTGDFRIFRSVASTKSQVLNLARSTGAATFSNTGMGTYGLTVGNTTDNLRIKLGTMGVGYPNIQATTISGGGAYQLSLQADGGNVLIGTTTDSGYKLDVNGTFRATGAATFSGNVNVTVPNTPEVFLTHSNTSKTFLMAVDGSNAFFRANSTNNILFQVAGGTTALTLASTSAATFSSSVTAAGALFTSATETRGNIRTTFASDNSYYSLFSNDGALTLDTYGVGGYMNFKILGSTKLTLTNTGNVGIGTTSPGSKLSIVGLPTSSSGLTSGDIWNDSGTLKIV